MARRLAASVAIGLVVCCAGCTNATTPEAPTPPLETAIHIFALAPATSTTLDFDAAVHLTAHFTLATRDAPAAGSSLALWACLGRDSTSFAQTLPGGATSDCVNTGNAIAPTGADVLLTVSSRGAQRAAPADTTYLHLLLVDGPLRPPGGDGAGLADYPLSQIAGRMVTRLAFPYVIHWR